MSEEVCATPSAASASVAGVQIQLLANAKARARARRRLAKHHYLGDVRAVGEQLWFALTDADGTWQGVLVFCAASRRTPSSRP